MRVIAGTAKGRKLLAVPGDTTRPILDRVKTALFDVLRPEIAGAKMLDLFAGSGAVGIEALSQGAAHCIFLDLSKNAVETIKKNLEATQLVASAEVRHYDAFSFLRNSAKSFDLIYVAPPQYESLWIQAMQTIAERPEILNPAGLIVVQIDPKEYEELKLAAFHETEQRKYGNTLLVFYRPTAACRPPD
ncbi:MAG: Ribosomal small subunit methyltransferase [Pseudomonadota bacterium]|jgi:16S rRNA (guanine(966)-N(2))-methyltransferase RsmD